VTSKYNKKKARGINVYLSVLMALTSRGLLVNLEYEEYARLVEKLSE